MEHRRGELDMTWDEVAEAAGTSSGTLYRLAGDPLAVARTWPQTRKGIERALHWKPGSIDAIQANEEPIRQEQTEPPTSVDEDEKNLHEIAELRRMAEAAKASAEESLAVASRLLDRIEQLGHSDELGHSNEHRSAQ